MKLDFIKMKYFLRISPLLLALAFTTSVSAQFLDPDAPEQKLLEYSDLEIELEEIPDSDEAIVDGNVFIIVDEMPEFPGGFDAMNRFIKRQMNYPEEAFEKSVQGNVYVSFLVLVDGTLDKFQLVSGIGHGCDEEAVRIARLMMTKWEPGKQMGRPVTVKYVLTVPFLL